jgi:hypothetical protein
MRLALISIVLAASMWSCFFHDHYPNARSALEYLNNRGLNCAKKWKNSTRNAREELEKPTGLRVSVPKQRTLFVDIDFAL